MRKLLALAVLLAGLGTLTGTASATSYYNWGLGGAYGVPSASCWTVTAQYSNCDYITNPPANKVTDPWPGSWTQSWPAQYGGDYTIGCPISNRNNVICDANSYESVSTDSSGNWNMGMSSCLHGGNPCHMEHNLYVYSQITPGNWNASFPGRPWYTMFGSNPVLQVQGNQTVDWYGGTNFHGFMCADLMNVTTAQTIEDCAETWTNNGYSHVGNPQVNGGSCGGGGAFGNPSLVAWTPLGGSTAFLSSYGTEQHGSTSPGFVAIFISWPQLQTLASQCGGSVGNRNDWALMFTESGFEGGGSPGYLEWSSALPNDSAWTDY